MDDEVQQQQIVTEDMDGPQRADEASRQQLLPQGGDVQEQEPRDGLGGEQKEHHGRIGDLLEGIVLGGGGGLERVFAAREDVKEIIAGLGGHTPVVTFPDSVVVYRVPPRDRIDEPEEGRDDHRQAHPLVP